MGSKVAVAIACVLAVPLLLTAGLIGIVTALTSSGGGRISCTPGGAPTSSLAGYGPDQLANAATITAVGTQLHIPEQGWVVAVAVAIQESTLHNLDHGDRDSLGLFQQRPSQGWGTPAQIMNPTYAATQFYQHLNAVPGWQQMSLNDAAQTVQRSGTPNAYGQHERTAEATVAAVSGVSCATTVGTGDCANIAAPNPAAMTAITTACRQRGLPFVWGGNGPDGGDAGFDCSGLTQAAYSAAGLSLPRTAHTQYAAGPHVPAGQPLLPGDLVFYGNANNIHHVGLYIGGGQMINAPTFGKPIQVGPYRYTNDDFYGATRPATQ
jgi:cell wall-associated NlpC family hydrolase